MKNYFEKLFKEDDVRLHTLLEERLCNQVKTLLVTANPEIFMSGTDNRVNQLLLDSHTIISPDGEGIVKGARMLGYPIWGKIAGVDTVETMLRFLDKHKLSLAVYGSKQEVLDSFHDVIKEEYPNLHIACLLNGYDYTEEQASQRLQEVKADCILVALGVPRQELFLSRILPSLDKGICIGCGGSIDVLSGTKKRAPRIFIKLKLEWLYRLVKEPKRIKRFYKSNVLYLIQIQKLRREMN